MKAIIIVYNRLTLPMKMADWLAERGVDPILLDNNSDYEPLLEYYETCPHEVIRLKNNYGCRAAWDVNLLDLPRIGKRFIMTDPDLDLSGIPDNFLEVLEEGLKRYPQFSKCGFSLDINDLPENDYTNVVRTHEMQFWQKPLDDMYYEADVDTTFALCTARKFTYTSLRTNRPYMAKHIPWYYQKKAELPDDEQYYLNTIKTTVSWSDKI